jgi:hypothetical protein
VGSGKVGLAFSCWAMKPTSPRGARSCEWIESGFVKARGELGVGDNEREADLRIRGRVHIMVRVDGAIV